MVDYYLNESFEIEDDQHGGYKLVDGKEEFQQKVIVELTEREREIMRNGFTKTTKEKIQLAVQRTAQNFNLVNEIRNINISRPVDKRSTFEVEVTFVTGGNFQETF
jgi:hypothetical protein